MTTFEERETHAEPADRTPWPRAVPPEAWVWGSTAAVVAGFALLAYAWAKVSLLTIVAAQLPYLVSSGLTGLGLITVGSAGLVVWSRRADDVERRRQTEELVEALRDIRTGMDTPTRRRG